MCVCMYIYIYICVCVIPSVIPVYCIHPSYTLYDALWFVLPGDPVTLSHLNPWKGIDRSRHQSLRCPANGMFPEAPQCVAPHKGQPRQLP